MKGSYDITNNSETCVLDALLSVGEYRWKR